MLHDPAAFLSIAVGIVCGAGSLGGMLRNLHGGCRHFLHGGGYLVRARELLSAAMGHAGSDGVQLSAGAIQLTGTALQLAEGVFQEAAQLVGRPGEGAQLVVPTQGDGLAKSALAQLFNLLDQLGYRADQAPVYQPQAEYADHHCCDDQYCKPDPDGGRSGCVDLVALLLCGSVQLAGQLVHVLADLTVDSARSLVACGRLHSRGLVGLQTVAIA